MFDRGEKNLMKHLQILLPPPSMFAGMYPLRSINKRLAEIIGACYSDNGIIRGKTAVYAPYSSKSDELCGNNQVRETSLALGDKGTARRGRGGRSAAPR